MHGASPRVGHDHSFNLILTTLSCSDEEKDSHVNRVKKHQEGKVQGLKQELKRMLATPIMSRGVSAKFITSGSRPIINDLLAGQSEFRSFLLDPFKVL